MEVLLARLQSALDSLAASVAAAAPLAVRKRKTARLARIVSALHSYTDSE